MSEERRYPLYEYLQFFWKKKLLLLFIPIVFAAIAALLSIMTAKGYEGTLIYYTSSIKTDQLTDPDMILEYYRSKYPEKEIDVNVVQKERVQFKVNGDNSEEVKKTLQDIASDYDARLMKEYNVRKDKTEYDIETYKKRLAEADQSLKLIKKAVQKEESFTLESYSELLISLSNMEEQVLKLETKIKNMKTDLIFFEKPKQVTLTVEKEQNNAMANSIIAFALGVFFTILSLMLWKYILDARKAVHHG
jgi:capsular polysaccharide biosynthesis protein